MNAVTTVTIINPFSGAEVVREIAEINAQSIAVLLDDDLIGMLDDATDPEWIAHYVELVGPVEAGRVILGS